jgi:TolB-like protein
MIVLPFTAPTDSGLPEGFAEAVSEDLTTELSRLGDTLVIAHATALTYRGRSLAPQQIGRDLGIRYVVSGNVRRLGETLTIGAELTDAENGARVWGERVSGDRAEMLRLNNELIGRIGNTLRREATVAVARRLAARSSAELDADDIAIQANAVFLRGASTIESLRASESLAEEALDRDPRSLRALQMRTRIQTLLYFRGAVARSEALRVVEDAASRAEAIDRHDYLSFLTRLNRAVLRFDWPDYLAVADEMLARFPSDATAHDARGLALMKLGRPEESFGPVEMAIRLSPRDPRLGTFYFHIADAHFALGNYAESIAWNRRALGTNPDFLGAQQLMPAALLLAGQEAEARDAFAALTRRIPELTAGRVLATSPSGFPGRLEADRRRVKALRRLGLPD